MRKETLIAIVVFFLLVTGILLFNNLQKLNSSNSVEIKSKPMSFITSRTVESQPVYEDKINFAKSSCNSKD